MNKQAMQVLGIAGSPRRGGNTEMLLDRFLRGAKEAGAAVEKVVAARLDVAGCIACNGCWEDGYCVVQDGFQDVYDKLVTADLIALAAPLFFWNLPAQVKALVDRNQCQWARKFVVRVPLAKTAAGRSRRRGIFISVGGGKRRYFEGVVKTVKDFFVVNEADYWGDLLIHNVDAKGKIEEHPTALDEALKLGARAVEEPWED